MGALLTVIAGLLVTLAVVVWAAVLLTRSPSHVDAGNLPANRPAAAAVPAAVNVPRPATLAAGRPGGPPRRLQLAALSVDAPVEPVGVASDGSLGVPVDVHTLGWWDHSAPAGATAGTTVIDGHVDSAITGPGALFHLAGTPLGASITLTSASRTFRYTVQARRSYPKSRLPADVFTRTGPARLVLVTCGGSFDTTAGHYSNNIVVYATPG